MANANIVYGKFRGLGLGSLPAIRMDSNEDISNPTVSTQGNFTSPASTTAENRYAAQVTADGGDLRVATGEDPTASASSGGGALVKSGTTRDFVLKPGWKIAVINAA